MPPMLTPPAWLEGRHGWAAAPVVQADAAGLPACRAGLAEGGCRGRSRRSGAAAAPQQQKASRLPQAAQAGRASASRRGGLGWRTGWRRTRAEAGARQPVPPCLAGLDAAAAPCSGCKHMGGAAGLASEASPPSNEPLLPSQSSTLVRLCRCPTGPRPVAGSSHPGACCSRRCGTPTAGSGRLGRASAPASLLPWLLVAELMAAEPLLDSREDAAAASCRGASQAEADSARALGGGPGSAWGTGWGTGCRGSTPVLCRNSSARLSSEPAHEGEESVGSCGGRRAADGGWAVVAPDGSRLGRTACAAHPLRAEWWPRPCGRAPACRASLGRGLEGGWRPWLGGRAHVKFGRCIPA